MKKNILIFFLLSIILNGESQIIGNLKLHANQELELIGYNNFKTEKLSITNVDSLGNFTLIYPNSYKGIAILKAEDKSSLAFILTENGIKIFGTALKENDKLVFENSEENNTFVQYFKDYSQRQSVLSAFYYLKNKYENEAFFKNQKSISRAINQEVIRIEKEDANYLSTLNKETYVSWYLPLKKMVSSMPAIIRHYTNKIPESIKQFRSIDFNNSNFKTSGLLKDVIEGHYMLLESSGQPSDSIYAQMNKSTKYLIDNLIENETLLNTTTDYLFNYLEKRSFYECSEYLAVALLSIKGCGLEDKLINKLEAYRKLKIGKIAPNIVFTDKTKLSDITSTKLLVFGASWCPKCKEDLSKLKKYYSAWKEKDVDVVYISIDTDKTDFKNTYNNTPWKTHCKFKGWDTPAVKDYHVFATPTYFLLDKGLKILLRPKSVEQVNSWVKSKLYNN